MNDIHDPWELYDRLNEEARYQQRVTNLKLSMVPSPEIISLLHETGRVSEEEYSKYVLSTDPLFIPKLKERNGDNKENSE